MGDHYMSIVPAFLELDDFIVKSEKIKHWLISDGIINDVLEDCTLGEEGGYRPGINYKIILSEGESVDDISGLAVNGVEFTQGRTVFHSGGNGLDEVLCPACKSDIIDSSWSDIVEDWTHGGKGWLECPNCNQKSQISNYDFNTEKIFPWAFSNFGVTFWNWPPPFKPEFLKGIEKILGVRLIVVYGHY